MTITELKSRLNEELEKMTVTAHENPAVARCARAYLFSYCDDKLKGESDDRARARAGVSYRLAMPPLTGSRNVRDFIACITHGMLIHVLDHNEATKFLYAAQVAHTARRPKNNSKKTVQEPVSPDNKPFSKQPPNA